MPLDDKIEHVDINKISIDKRFAPPIVEKFVQMYQNYLERTVPVYSCSIPSVYVKPYSLSYYPTEWKPFSKLKDEYKRRIAEKQYPHLWVYQEGRFFIMPDDYPSYYAYLESGEPVIYMLCLGKPIHESLLSVSKPHFCENTKE